MNQTEEISGTVERFLFQSAESGFAVVSVKISIQHSIVATGHFVGVSPGQEIVMQGSWTNHQKFGRQFAATSCTSKLPNTIHGLQKFFSSGIFKGIGKVFAEKIIAYFGTGIIDIIEKNPERLQEVGGVGVKRAEQLVKAWKDQKEISSIMIFLQDKEVTPAYAIKIYKKYGNQSIAIVTENPYRLAEDIWGIGFKMADNIAQKLGFFKESVARFKAGIIHAINMTIAQGSLYVELKELKKMVFELLELDATNYESTVKIALHELYEQTKIKIISQKDDHFITTAIYYWSEKNLATKLEQLVERPSNHHFDLEKIYLSLRQADAQSMALNEDQQRAILTALQSKITIITGGPGTGKTTLVKKLLTVLDELQLSYRLAAPTGRAAKRLMEGTGRHALTIHRLLEFDVSTMSFAHNEQNALKLNFLIIDEASMLDVFLAYALVKALPLGAHLVFIGDIDQLPSVGAGNVLQDLILSQKIPTIRLIHIFRQAQDSLIIVNAHRINRGEFPISSLENAKKDFIFIKEERPENVRNHLEKLYKKIFPTHYAHCSEAMTLVPMNRGIIGTFKLNQDLQIIINPDENKKNIQHMGRVFKEGDKVMQIRNNYDKFIFNGDIGVLEQIDNEQELIKVNFLDKIIEYAFTELDELVLAYAISIHKSQGSEYDIIVVPLFMHHFMLLQKNLIYTAITRAKKLCIFIGQPKAIAIAIKNEKTYVRKTFLKEFLTSDLACR